VNARCRTVTGNLAPLALEPEKLVITADLARRSGGLRLLAGSQDRRHRRNIGIVPGGVKHTEAVDRIWTVQPP